MVAGMEEQTVDQTVVFADIAGSMRIYEEKGNEEGRRLILGCLDLVAEILARENILDGLHVVDFLLRYGRFCLAVRR